MSLQAVYETYRKQADFYWVYTKEAHASDGSRPARHADVAQHKTLKDRQKAATACVAAIDLKIPVLLDDMKNSVATAFHGHPDRLFILSPDGTIAYRGGKGPHGFNVAEMKAALARLVKEAANLGLLDTGPIIAWLDRSDPIPTTNGFGIAWQLFVGA